MEGMRRLDETYRLRRRLPAPAVVRYVGGEAEDALEVRVLGYLGPGARTVGDVVEGLLVGGDADEYDALQRAATTSRPAGPCASTFPGRPARLTRRPAGHLNLSLNVEAGPVASAIQPSTHGEESRHG